MLCELHGRNFNGEKIDIPKPAPVIVASSYVKVINYIEDNGKKKILNLPSSDREKYFVYCVLPDRIVYLGEDTRIMCNDVNVTSDRVVRYASWRQYEDDEQCYEKFIKSRECGEHNEHGQDFLDAVDGIFIRHQMRKIVESLLGEDADLENREQNL
jgi:hypothetical protein